MVITIRNFIKKYTEAIIEGSAAVFAGAGLSQPSGYQNWRELIRPFADEIGLNVDKEHDLISVTQYYCNSYRGRGELNRKILNEFTKDTKDNHCMEIITRLPISTYWTTNYDELIEQQLKGCGRKPDIKTNQEDLANNISERDAIIYKMHGDVRSPQDAVITKDDYELYNNKRPLFVTALQGDLISKTFLFIGFSFEDPNLSYILGRIRVLIGESGRQHYCFFEKIINKGDTREYEYSQLKQQLRIDDLSRYGIQAVLLDSYDEIASILQQIETKVKSKNVFISGSISNYDSIWDKDKVGRFSYKLSNQLVKNGFRVGTGFGLDVGSSVINGALDEIMRSKYKHIDEYLYMRPFPQINIGGATSLAARWTGYRREMISESGIVVFMFGNKIDRDKTIVANGMLEEFSVAKELGKVIIPIGSTGYAAKQIFDDVKANISYYPYLKSYIDMLENQIDEDDLVELITNIVMAIFNG